MLNIYWRYLCCESRIPVDARDPETDGRGMCNSEDFDRFGEWAHTMQWCDWDGCPECDAPAPLIYGREFVIG